MENKRSCRGCFHFISDTCGQGCPTNCLSAGLGDPHLGIRVE